VTRGAFTIQRACESCAGRGTTEPCAGCAGEGSEARRERLQVQIPEGVEQGQVLRLRGKGNVQADGATGDLYLVLELRGLPTRQTVPASTPLHAAVSGPHWLLWTALAVVIAASVWLSFH
jgi:hypothetical protein